MRGLISALDALVEGNPYRAFADRLEKVLESKYSNCGNPDVPNIVYTGPHVFGNPEFQIKGVRIPRNTIKIAFSYFCRFRYMWIL